MNYLSVCSGIEAATVAWHPLGWNPIAFSEIELFPNKVLAYHYPDVPNLGDMTKFKEWQIGTDDVDILVGGTPCQSFSVAGLRKGLDDPRGNLMLTYLAIADKYRPIWTVWENVPGVLSSNGGRDFGTFLGAMEKLGYGFAYRVLDAQYVRTDGYPHAVPQRRRRVFVVGYIGSWQRAAAVLFDSESLRGNPPPRREAGQGTTHAVAPCLAACGRGTERIGDTRGQDAVIASICMSHGQANAEISVGLSPTLNCNHEQPIAFIKSGFDVLGFNAEARSDEMTVSDSSAALSRSQHSAVAQTLRENYRNNSDPVTEATMHIYTNEMQVRRLTPTECERLQGFPDNYTNIPAASDTTRYKALGNSMACNVMQLIGQRIQMVSEI